MCAIQRGLFLPFFRLRQASDGMLSAVSLRCQCSDPSTAFSATVLLARRIPPLSEHYISAGFFPRRRVSHADMS